MKGFSKAGEFFASDHAMLAVPLDSRHVYPSEQGHDSWHVMIRQPDAENPNLEHDYYAEFPKEATMPIYDTQKKPVMLVDLGKSDEPYVLRERVVDISHPGVTPKPVGPAHDLKISAGQMDLRFSCQDSSGKDIRSAFKYARPEYTSPAWEKLAPQPGEATIKVDRGTSAADLQERMLRAFEMTNWAPLTYETHDGSKVKITPQAARGDGERPTSLEDVAYFRMFSHDTDIRGNADLSDVAKDVVGLPEAVEQKVHANQSLLDTEAKLLMHTKEEWDLCGRVQNATLDLMKGPANRSGDRLSFAEEHTDLIGERLGVSARQVARAIDADRQYAQYIGDYRQVYGSAPRDISSRAPTSEMKYGKGNENVLFPLVDIEDFAHMMEVDMASFAKLPPEQLETAGRIAAAANAYERETGCPRDDALREHASEVCDLAGIAQPEEQEMLSANQICLYQKGAWAVEGHKLSPSDVVDRAKAMSGQEQKKAPEQPTQKTPEQSVAETETPRMAQASTQSNPQPKAQQPQAAPEQEALAQASAQTPVQTPSNPPAEAKQILVTKKQVFSVRNNPDARMVSVGRVSKDANGKETQQPGFDTFRVSASDIQARGNKFIVNLDPSKRYDVSHPRMNPDGSRALTDASSAVGAGKPIYDHEQKTGAQIFESVPQAYQVKDQAAQQVVTISVPYTKEFFPNIGKSRSNGEYDRLQFNDPSSKDGKGSLKIRADGIQLSQDGKSRATVTLGAPDEKLTYSTHGSKGRFVYHEITAADFAAKFEEQQQAAAKAARQSSLNGERLPQEQSVAESEKPKKPSDGGPTDGEGASFV